MLAEAERIDAAPRFAPRASVVMVMLLVPAGALALYLIGGAPGLPAQPLKERIARAEARTREEAALIDQLRAKLATLDPNSEQARQGYLLLGRVELSRGHLDAAAAAWNTALTAKFDPTLAVETAEVETEASGRVTDASAALFRKALDAAPADAPWRPMAEKRLAEAKAGGAITPPSASDAASGAKMN
jgi:cytochrome c-type biogenesis protein CcmH